MPSARADGAASIDLHDLVTSLREQGCMTPCLFRFTDIVGHRLSAIQVSLDLVRPRCTFKADASVKQGCFMAAMSKYGYKVCL